MPIYAVSPYIKQITTSTVRGVRPDGTATVSSAGTPKQIIDKYSKADKFDILAAVSEKGEKNIVQALKAYGVKNAEPMVKNAANFLSTSVRLDTGEYIDRGAFESLPSDKQVVLKQSGIEKFNAQFSSQQPIEGDGSTKLLQKPDNIAPGQFSPQELADMGIKGKVIAPGVIQYGDIVDVNDLQMSKSEYDSLSESEKQSLVTSAAQGKGGAYIQGLNKIRGEEVKAQQISINTQITQFMDALSPEELTQFKSDLEANQKSGQDFYTAFNNAAQRLPEAMKQEQAKVIMANLQKNPELTGSIQKLDAAIQSMTQALDAAKGKEDQKAIDALQATIDDLNMRREQALMVPYGSEVFVRGTKIGEQFFDLSGYDREGRDLVTSVIKTRGVKEYESQVDNTLSAMEKIGAYDPNTGTANIELALKNGIREDRLLVSGFKRVDIDAAKANMSTAKPLVVSGITEQQGERYTVTYPDGIKEEFATKDIADAAVTIYRFKNPNQLKQPTIAVSDKVYVVTYPDGMKDTFISKDTAQAALEIYAYKVKARQEADKRLTAYGFTESKGPFIVAEDSPRPKNFTVDNLAEFARNNKDGVKVLIDYGFSQSTISNVIATNKAISASLGEIDKYMSNDKYGSQGIALDNAFMKSGVKFDPIPFRYDTRIGAYIDDANERVLSQKDLLRYQWGTLSQSQKEQIAKSIGQDPNANNYFAGIVEQSRIIAEKSGIVGSVLYSPILPVVSPLAKQLTLDDAKTILKQQYITELKSLSGYVKVDGSFDTTRLSKDMESNPTFANSVLQQTGYPNKEALNDSLGYYNAGTRVTLKEWGTAGLVAALDATIVGGAALSSLGAGAKILVEAVGFGAPIALGVIQAPDVVKTIASPKVGTGEKVFTGVGEVAMFLPLGGPAIRAGQFAKIVSSPDYTPLRSMSMESSTARVPFTDAQLTKMRAAGVTEQEIVRAGTQITEQLASGVKVAEVNLGPVTVKVRNVPYQRSVGRSLFNATPDISVVDRGGSVPLIRKFYTAGKVAIEPLERAYLTGQRATKPGIIEIRIDDPQLIGKIAPQERLISGGKTLEPEAPIPSLEELQGMGYRLEPIPGKLGKGVTFDANLGKVEIRRYTLTKVVDNPTGLVRVKTGASGNGGVVAVGDLHGTSNFRSVYDDVNSSFDKPVINGNPDRPETWHWESSENKGRTLVIMGDSIDRGQSYKVWRDTLNRLQSEAKVSGDRVERLLGNHELAYLSDDAIKGIKYTDKERVAIKAGLLEDIRQGRVKAATAAEGKVFTHAGVSTGVFPELRPKTLEGLSTAQERAQSIANYLNREFEDAVVSNDYSGKMFAKGRVEKGNSLSKNEQSQGGIFWLRPQEAKLTQLDLGVGQVVGHNPGFGVRRIWGDNFIETDISRRTGGTGVYSDTPYMKSIPADIITKPIEGTAPKLTTKIMAELKMKAMRDTLADMVLGWDGRVQAVEKIKASQEAVEALIKSLNKQIEERKAAGDSIGVKYLERQKKELISPTGRDYLYGGVGFWRDIAMGRQNSVKILGQVDSMTREQLLSTIPLIGAVRSRITEMSDRDVNYLFGRSKSEIIRRLDTSNLDTTNDKVLREGVNDRLRATRDIVDEGLERGVSSYLDRESTISRYSRRFQNEVTRSYGEQGYYDASYRPTDNRVMEDARYSESGGRDERSGIVELRAPFITRPIDLRVIDTRMTEIRGGSIRPPDRIPETRGVERHGGIRIITPITGVTIETPPPKVPVVPLPKESSNENERREEFRGSVAWKQGFGYWAIKAPYKTQQDVGFFYKTPPPGATVVKGGANSAYKSIQALGVEVPSELVLNLGIQRVVISAPTKEPGKPGGIQFIESYNSPVTKEVPEGVDINLKLHEIPTSKRRSGAIPRRLVSTEACRKFGSTFEDALTYEPTSPEQADFISKQVTNMLPNMSVTEIVSRIKALGLTLDDAQTQMVLSHLPDIQRKMVERQLSTPSVDTSDKVEPTKEQLASMQILENKALGITQPKPKPKVRYGTLGLAGSPIASAKIANLV